MVFFSLASAANRVVSICGVAAVTADETDASGETQSEIKLVTKQATNKTINKHTKTEPYKWVQLARKLHSFGPAAMEKPIFDLDQIGGDLHQKVKLEIAVVNMTDRVPITLECAGHTVQINKQEVAHKARDVTLEERKAGTWKWKVALDEIKNGDACKEYVEQVEIKCSTGNWGSCGAK